MCHVSATSANMVSQMSQGLFLKNLYFTTMESKTFFLQGAKLKVAYITGGKTLLTLNFSTKFYSKI